MHSTAVLVICETVSVLLREYSPSPNLFIISSPCPFPPFFHLFPLHTVTYTNSELLSTFVVLLLLSRLHYLSFSSRLLVALCVVVPPTIPVGQVPHPNAPPLPLRKLTKENLSHHLLLLFIPFLPSYPSSQHFTHHNRLERIFSTFTISFFGNLVLVRF